MFTLYISSFFFTFLAQSSLGYLETRRLQLGGIIVCLYIYFCFYFNIFFFCIRSFHLSSSVSNSLTVLGLCVFFAFSLSLFTSVPSSVSLSSLLKTSFSSFLPPSSSMLRLSFYLLCFFSSLSLVTFVCLSSFFLCLYAVFIILVLLLSLLSFPCPFFFPAENTS